MQPVRAAGESLMPVHHTIAGSRLGQVPPGDGVVPLTGAACPALTRPGCSTLGDVHMQSEAIAEVLRILREAP